MRAITWNMRKRPTSFCAKRKIKCLRRCCLHIAAAFDRSRDKGGTGAPDRIGQGAGSGAGVTVAEVRDEEKARILLRMSATVGSIGELGPLLEAILDQLGPGGQSRAGPDFFKG